jgi:hypothetical protein
MGQLVDYASIFNNRKCFSWLQFAQLEVPEPFITPILSQSITMVAELWFLPIQFIPIHVL